jgi:hypothetical protein
LEITGNVISGRLGENRQNKRCRGQGKKQFFHWSPYNAAFRLQIQLERSVNDLNRVGLCGKSREKASFFARHFLALRHVVPVE